ncbi:MAG: hypothetical protein QM759_12730 [Terricaulis sp.]
MTAIPHAAEALTSALDRLDRANTRVLGAVSGAANEDIGSALADASQARMQFRATVALVRMSDDMFKELMNIRAND